jgi:hypothetical protein
MPEKTRADEGGPFREFVFEEWLRDGIEGMRQKMEQKKAHFDPSNFRKHMRNAQKEQLLAIRDLIDNAIEHVERQEEKEEEKSEA